MSQQNVQPDTKTPGASAAAIWAALVAVYIIWGSTYLAIRFAVETMPPFLMAGARFLVAGVMLYAFRRARGDAAPTKVEWRSAAIVGVLLLAGGNGGVVWAEQRVASGVASLFIGTVPLWMVALDALRALRPGGQRPSARAAAGVAIGFAGIALLIGPDQLVGRAGEIDLLGGLVLLVAAFFWSLGSLYSRAADLPTSPLLGTSMEMLLGGAGLLVMALSSGELGRLNLAAISMQSWLGLAFLIVFGSWGGFAAYTWLLRNAPTPLVATYAYVNPIVAVGLGYWLAAEPLTLRTLVSAAIIVSSVALTTLAHPPSLKPKPARPKLKIV